MSVIPKSNTEKINFFENRLALWASNAATIGIDATQATQIAGLTVQARAAFDAAQIARNAAKSATIAQNEAIEAIDAMGAYGADLVKTIRAYAETNEDPAVYPAADLPLPKPRTPLGPAPTPESVSLALTNAGGISVSWKTETLGRMGFVIERRTAAPGQLPTAWSIIGTSSTKNFIDEAVPTGLETAQYRVFAERPGGRSQPTEAVSVFFGTASQSGAEGDLRIAA